MATEASTPEPIAVIGLGCRVAGNVATPSEFWNFLLEGRSNVTEVPDERWEPYLRRDPRNAAILREAISDANSPRFLALLPNAAVALVLAGVASDFVDAAQMVRDAVASGRAAATLAKLAELSQSKGAAS